MLMEEKVPDVPVAPEEGAAYEKAVPSTQLKNVPSH
jgi:hypothetical protein